MRLRHKLLTTLLAMSMSIPTFAGVKLEDTFTYGNIENTIGMACVKHTTGNVCNNYIIASNNTIMVKGVTALGVGGSNNNSTTVWKPVLTDSSGNTLNNVVNISAVAHLYAIDCFGDAYCVETYANKINIDGVKFKDVGECYYYDWYSNSVKYTAYLIAENGDLYKGQGTNFTKVEDIKGVKEIRNTTNDKTNGSSKVINSVLLTDSGELYRIDYSGNCTKINDIANVSTIYGGYSGYYIKFNSGKISFLSASNTLTDIAIPNDESFEGIFADSKTVGLITNKNVYVVNDAKITLATATNTYDSSKIKPVNSTGDIVIDSSGGYYTWVLSGTDFKFTPVEGIEEWVNENPVVLESELANFDIPLNKIFKRLKNYDVKFSLVTEKQPTAFNMYYTKTENSSNKEKWVEIKKNIQIDELSPEVYDTGYVNSDDTPITGFTYTYNWEVGKEDLVGVHLIVEPVYN